ncbi:glycosyltransferase family 2 protein [Fortiea contorta]|uniref:glycosyltransferase family 2 protein n=1 Tax=Fortiea contorta TaxID=1892405 RepID=UPI0003450BD3|nr:glycosyltransferase family 2 protein [Fortiea contorta]
MHNATLPTISLAIPTYNEASHIKKLIKGFLSTEYPNLIEIIVADGGSTDDTQEIVQKLSVEDSRVQLIHNPLKIQSAGLNLILHECKGEVFLRADAHSDYAPDYIEKCIEALLESKAVNVGGAQRFAAKTPFQAGIALSSKSILGSGGAKYRDVDYDGYAETVYLGCFWRKSLLEVSGYCVEATPNEDAELNQRLIKDNSQAIYISSKIHVWYYPRKTWKSLWIQYFKYGGGRYRTTTKHSIKLQMRGMIPFLVISITTLILFVDLLFPQLGLPMEILVLCGILLPFLESWRITAKFNKDFVAEIWRGDKDKIPSFLSRWFLCGVTLLIMPLAHSSGYAYQLVRHKILRVSDW